MPFPTNVRQGMGGKPAPKLDLKFDRFGPSSPISLTSDEQAVFRDSVSTGSYLFPNAYPGTDAGIQVFKPSSNSIYPSEMYDTTGAKWNLQGATIVPTDAERLIHDDPFLRGLALSASMITQDTSVGSPHGAYQAFSRTGDWTFSCYAKKGTNDGLAISPDDTGFVHFDLKSGSIGLIDNPSDHHPLMEDVGRGWYRCSVRSTQATSHFDIDQAVRSVPGGQMDTHVFTGDGASTIYVAGVQVENAVDYPGLLKQTMTATHAGVQTLATVTLPANIAGATKFDIEITVTPHQAWSAGTISLVSFATQYAPYEIWTYTSLGELVFAMRDVPGNLGYIWETATAGMTGKAQKTIKFSYDASVPTVLFYVDGVQYATTTGYAGDGALHLTGPMLIGDLNGSYTNPSDSWFKEIKITKRG